MEAVGAALCSARIARPTHWAAPQSSGSSSCSHIVLRVDEHVNGLRSCTGNSTAIGAAVVGAILQVGCRRGRWKRRLGRSTGRLLGRKAHAWEDLETLLPSSQVGTRRYDTALNPKKPDLPGLTLFRERNGWCPYSERVWLAMEVKGLTYDTVLVDNMGSRPGWYGGQTPQVQWQPRERQGESLDIIRELEDKYPDSGIALWPWDEAVTELVNSFRKIFPQRSRPSSRAAFLFDQSGPIWRSTFEATLDGTDELLGKHGGPFFFGKSLTVADCAWAPFLERYAAQLPCLHEGLRPYDASRWPRLAAWYEAMLQVPAYAARVCGDTVSWRKVLAQAGYGNAGVAPELIEEEATVVALGASGMDEAKSQDLWQQYISSTGASQQHAATPREEVAAVIVRNRKALIKDAMRHGGLSEEDADAGLRGLASLLQEARDGEPLGSIKFEADPSMQASAAYLDDRLCVP
eukprot:CAMPEP_0178422310 /NCGR_PEP_ID=MMETSP0689_2-20121128/27105_1 /TAXON_ID=160604 /ORGANISM="Amphidinium massartii, Strain CS-259" /LENGTH=461 /DNA_ID=CAMNT_0020043865 /DNA_START=8 /DNA_END=1389 /DNA_ORIENTATION=-